MTAAEIKTMYEQNGLRVDKIIRAKLDDGFYVYHEFASAHKSYKPAKIIKQTGNMTIKQTQPYQIKCDFIDDDSVISLEIAVMESMHRAGLHGKLKTVKDITHDKTTN